MLRTTLLALLVAVLLPLSPLHGHDPGLSSLALRLDPVFLTGRLTLSSSDAATLVDMTNERPESAERTTATIDHFLASQIPGLLEIRTDGAPVLLPELHPRRDQNNNVELEFSLPAPRSALTLRSMLVATMPRGHRQHLTVEAADERLLGEKLLSAAANEFAASIPAPESPAGTAALPSETTASQSVLGYYFLGVEHILTGFDHLLFLFALIVTGVGLRRAVGIITSFTVAHSMTLALSVLGVLRIPSSVVEPIIAFSVAWVAVENLLHRDSRHRWALTFLFGLAHGLGFAAALGNLATPGNSTPLFPLALFNLGVESGQLAVASLVLPLVWALKRSTVAFALCTTVASLATVALGVSWLIQRTVGL